MNGRLNIENKTGFDFIGKRLYGEICEKAYKLEATDVVIRKAKFDRWAEVDLFENGNAIAWSLQVSVQ